MLRLLNAESRTGSTHERSRPITRQPRRHDRGRQVRLWGQPPGMASVYPPYSPCSYQTFNTPSAITQTGLNSLIEHESVFQQGLLVRLGGLRLSPSTAAFSQICTFTMSVLSNP